MIYLLGGSTDFSDEVAQSLKKNIVTANRIVFVPGIYEDNQLSLNQMDEILKAFEAIDIVFQQSILLNENSEIEWMAGVIEEADVVYLMDGNPVKQMAFVKAMAIDVALEKYDNVLIGNSAGALNLSRHSILTRDVSKKDGIVYDGLDLAEGISVDINYQDEISETIASVQRDYGIDKIYGIPKSSAIFINEGALDFLGSSPVHMLLNGVEPMEILDLLNE